MSQASTSDERGGLDSNRFLDVVKETTASVMFYLRVAAHEGTAGTAEGMRRCFVELTSATQAAMSVASTSTEFQSIAPEVKSQLDAMLAGARHEIFEDGMNNIVTERLPFLLARHFATVIPAIAALIEAGRVSPLVGAEILKELGRRRSPESHELRRWILEHALHHSNPATRDAAALGLARLADPRSIPSVRLAVTQEPIRQLKDDLQLVLDELAEGMNPNGGAAAIDLEG